jgi:possible dipeptide/oligopeptide/nickel (ni2+) ABC superfamily ATP binding cassette transporter binding protein oppA
MLFLSACSSSSSSTSGSAAAESAAQVDNAKRLEDKEEVRIAAELFGSLDPCTGWGEYGEPLIQSKLMKIKSASIENDLATEYSVSEDSLTWTFKIRDDVKFHDGSKLTASDVAFTFNNTKALAGSLDLSNLKEAVAIDDTTVEFRMNEPFSSFLYVSAALGIVPEKTYVNSETYAKHPIGSGPLKFVQYDEGQQLILERNDDYYGEKMKFKRFVMVLMESSSAYAAAKAGEVDIALVDHSMAETQVEGYSFKPMESYDYRILSMPCTKGGNTTEQGDPMGNDVTSDIAIRKALAVGLNRQAIVDDVLEGYGEPIFDMFAKFPWGIADEVANFKDGDVEAAKKILDDAGWVVGADGIREKDGVKASFELLYGASAKERQAVALGVEQQAKELGIEIKPTGKDWDEIKKLGKSQAMVLGGGQYNPMAIKNLFDSEYADQSGWSNVVGYKSDKTDEYIKKAINATTEEEAIEYWREALWDGNEGPSILGDAVYVPICFAKHVYIVRDGMDLGGDIILPHDHGVAIMENITKWDYKK